MKDNFKITREIAGQLDTLAGELPTVAKTRSDGTALTRMVTVTGKKILDDGYVPKKGDPAIDPKVMYHTPVLVFFNHRQEMENIYKKQGLDGVHIYSAMIRRIKANSDAAIAGSSESWIKKFFKKFKSLLK